MRRVGVCLVFVRACVHLQLRLAHTHLGAFRRRRVCWFALGFIVFATAPSAVVVVVVVCLAPSEQRRVGLMCAICACQRLGGTVGGTCLNLCSRFHPTHTQSQSAEPLAPLRRQRNQPERMIYCEHSLLKPLGSQRHRCRFDRILACVCGGAQRAPTADTRVPPEGGPELWDAFSAPQSPPLSRVI